MSDTIFALSSGAPPAGIAVIRISGPEAFAAVTRLAGELPSPRRASLRTLRHDGEALDRALVLVFPGPATATGEDLAELHLHGGRAVVRAVEAALAASPGLRGAEPGEFTRRALTNGRIDLTEAEGLGDLLAAETEMQRRTALRAAEGGVRARIDAWAARALRLSALVEAMLDHADEDDVAGEGDVLTTVQRDALTLAAEIEAVTAQPPVERIRDGIRIVLAGQPNAGKSTLLNALAGREAAIVSPLAGTTRDRIEVPVMRDGIAYLLTDTAGLHAAPADIVEEIGIARARSAIESADLVLWLDDAPLPTELADLSHLLIYPRADAPGREAGATDRLSVSAETGQGVEALWNAIAALSAALLPPSDSVALNIRQRSLAEQSAVALHAAAAQDELLLAAEELRAALRAFHRITGAADVEAMLDALFGRFCIGK
ncbi:tRNA uridine-5-carboxymethylaminomethyl(34) synthesis GTPase MnmE [Sphingomonas sp. R647]|uniref:tRNA uridine-5-carboxymethylaminomethyl(34) synthesis GTPase MnmE n=1 Tax=Sphingomonas sp. R647 TaxID=2875233 RepID=UPI001CD64FCA|nr:tRNA uridine-5-carboxymethylaminomethyl(34) synthesis GTPase MnmE [Sphingomonas sp. R647]MCA1198499.1 tRNA uridine-5-carboxymethylaminomethyl(34) synthesis GTPase MnmE [Sphingomonas sp. R647]